MIDDPAIKKARKRYAAGRRIRLPVIVRTVRDIIRYHLATEGKTQGSLAGPWNCKPETVKTIMSRRSGRPMSSQYIDAVVEHLRLDDFDATKLHKQAAREAGYKIDGPEL